MVCSELADSGVQAATLATAVSRAYHDMTPRMYAVSHLARFSLSMSCPVLPCPVSPVFA